MAYLILRAHGPHEVRGVVLSHYGEQLGRVLVRSSAGEVLDTATAPHVLQRIRIVDPGEPDLTVVGVDDPIPDPLRRELRLLWGLHYAA